MTRNRGNLRRRSRGTTQFWSILLRLVLIVSFIGQQCGVVTACTPYDPGGGGGTGGGSPSSPIPSVPPPDSPPPKNPARPPATTGCPIYLERGAVVESATDLTVSGPTFSWRQFRSYDSLVAGGTQLGGKWVSANGDFRLVQEGDDVALLATASSKQVFIYDSGSGTYSPPADSEMTLEHVDVDDEFVLTNWVSGAVFTFHDFSVSHPGMLKESTTLGWQAADGGEGDGWVGTLYTYLCPCQLAGRDFLGGLSCSGMEKRVGGAGGGASSPCSPAGGGRNVWGWRFPRGVFWQDAWQREPGGSPREAFGSSA